jgi:hypothetical protein
MYDGLRIGPKLEDIYKPSPKVQEMLQQAADNISAKGMHDRIVELINDFEKDLNDEYEAGARLVSFGQSVQFNIVDVGFYNPNLIMFSGLLDDGSHVQLVQHMSQLSFLLIAMKRQNPEQPRRKIGFRGSCTEESNQASDQSAATEE